MVMLEQNLHYLVFSKAFQPNAIQLLSLATLNVLVQ